MPHYTPAGVASETFGLTMTEGEQQPRSASPSHCGMIDTLAVRGIVVDTVAEGRRQGEAASIGDVAVEAFLVEATRQPSELVNVAFERLFSSPERNPYPAWNPHPNLIRNYRLSDVVLDGQFRGLFNERGFIRGSSYIVADEQMMAIEVDPGRLIKGPDDVTVIIGCNVASGDNYFHWIAQALPAIDASLRREGQDRKVAVALPVLRPWQEASLRALGYAGVPRVVLDDQRKQVLLSPCRVQRAAAWRGNIPLVRSKLSDIFQNTHESRRHAAGGR